MKKIYLVLQHFSPSSGSFSGVFDSFAKYCSTKGYKVIILANKRDKKEQDFESLDYAEVIRFPFFQFPIFSNFFQAMLLSFKIKKYFKKSKEDSIIYVNGEAALGLARNSFVLRTGDLPITIFGSNLSKYGQKRNIISVIGRKMHFKLMEIIEKNYFKNAKAYVFSSKKVQSLFYDIYHQNEKPQIIPRSGIDIQEKPIFRKKINTILFISSGAEKIRKGALYLECALPNLFEKYKSLKLIHIGEKFQWNIPKKYKNRIISIGNVAYVDIKDYYLKTDLFVSSSICEGIPNTILESVSFGIPIITTDIEGIEEYLSHLKEGYICKRADGESLNKAISYMIDNPRKAYIMARKAQRKLKRLEYSNYNKHLLQFLEEIYSNKKKSINLIN